VKVFTYGVDQLTVNLLKESDYDVIPQTKLPDAEVVESSAIIVTSEVVPVGKLTEFSEKFQGNTILYHYMVKGIRGYQQVHATCERLGVHFLSPRATSKTYLDKLLSISETDLDIQIGNLIGFFGSGPGVGCTRSAATFAKRIAQTGKKVMMLGLDLYDPGYDGNPTVSLDKWRPRITGRILQDNDFDHLLTKESFSYLPGNYDYIGIQDYQEDEIEYLLEKAQSVKGIDVVIADLGSIPESAAWYVGLQKSNIRIFVTHPSHHYRIDQIFEVCRHLDVFPTDFSMVVNRSDVSHILTPKSLSQEIGMDLMIEFPHIEKQQQLTLGLGKRELQLLDAQVNHILAALGIKDEPAKKRGLIS
jgi:hypothetical protein